MEYLQELTLELNSNTAYTTIGAKQGDGNSRVLKIHITENGLDWKIPINADASYRVRKPDGYAVWNEAIPNLDENVVLLTLTEQTLAVAGRAYADIVFSVGTGAERQILSTVSFIIIIMASPDITQQVISSNEFGDILDLTENAKNVLNEGEAWANGSKSGVPVLADSFSYSVIGNEGLECTIDPNIFREYMGRTPGYTTYYTFTCTASSDSQKYPNGIWQLAWGNNLISDIGVTTIDNPITLADFGITLDGRPYQSNIIRVLVTDSDQQYHNNAKYWSDRTFSAQESIENLDISAETIPDEDATSEVEKTTISDVYVSDQPDGFDITVDDETFVSRVGELPGDYIFYFNGTNWTLNGQTIILSDYGISNVSSADEGNTFTIHYNQHKHFNFKIPRGRTGNVNFMTFYINPADGQLYTVRPVEVPNQLDFRIIESGDNAGCLAVVIDTEVVTNG